MKTIKLFALFLVFLLCAVVVLWVLGVLPTSEAFDIMTKSGSVLGVLFLGALMMQLIVKKPTKTGNPHPKNRQK